MSTNPDHINQLAAIIREVQGTRRMGAAALAKAILSCPASQWLLGNPPAALAQQEAEGATDPRCCDCGALWLDVPLRMDEGQTQRGNSNGGPTTPKPPIKPQFPPARKIREGFL